VKFLLNKEDEEFLTACGTTVKEEERK